MILREEEKRKLLIDNAEKAVASKLNRKPDKEKGKEILSLKKEILIN